MGRLLIVAPGPTANGDLHLGHLAGPFLSADVCARYARASGRDTLFGTGVHFTQNYIVTTARRLGEQPEQLRLRAAEQVEATLAAAGIEPDGFVRFDERYVKTVRRFFERLHADGQLRLRPMTFPYLPATGEFLTDAYVSGSCPVCLGEGCAGLCENCGHWIASGELIGPTSTQHPELAVELREREVLVLPLEEHRAALTAYFERLAPTMRPRLAQLVEELMAAPLPDYPITLPIDWGIPAPFAETPGQVLYSDTETIAWSLHAIALAAEARGEVPGDHERYWTAQAEPEVVYFFGSDASFAFALAGTAMLLALGGLALPAHFVTNEFYELDSDKFSTSRGHVVTGRQLAAEVPRDLIRYYLAATAPDCQRTNFTRASMDQVCQQRLVEPWNRVAEKAEQFVGLGELPVSERSRQAGKLMVERFAASFGPRRFSLTGAAFTLTEQLGRLDRRQVTARDAGDFWHELDLFLRCAAPLLVDLAAAGLVETAIPAEPQARSVRPRPLPRLTGGQR
ncbi:class I tRNA ligase family protein [Kitasatospora sp. P5_F3]